MNQYRLEIGGSTNVREDQKENLVVAAFRPTSRKGSETLMDKNEGSIDQAFVLIQSTRGRVGIRLVRPMGISLCHIVSVPNAKPHANNEYAQRIDRVIDHLRANLHRPVKLAELANVAWLLGISLPSDFYRRFRRNPE